MNKMGKANAKGVAGMAKKPVLANIGASRMPMQAGTPKTGKYAGQSMVKKGVK